MLESLGNYLNELLDWKSGFRGVIEKLVELKIPFELLNSSLGYSEFHTSPWVQLRGNKLVKLTIELKVNRV